MSKHGPTDRATEERRVRLREGNDEVGTYLEDAFDGTVEVILYGIPLLLWTVLAGPFTTKGTVIVSMLSLCFAVGLLRNGRLIRRRWPPSRTSLFWFRVFFYNGVLAGMVVLERTLWGAGYTEQFSAVPLVAGPLAAVLSFALAVAFPWLAEAYLGFRSNSW